MSCKNPFPPGKRDLTIVLIGGAVFLDGTLYRGKHVDSLPNLIPVISRYLTGSRFYQECDDRSKGGS